MQKTQKTQLDDIENVFKKRSGKWTLKKRIPINVTKLFNENLEKQEIEEIEGKSNETEVKEWKLDDIKLSITDLNIKTKFLSIAENYDKVLEILNNNGITKLKKPSNWYLVLVTSKNYLVKYDETQKIDFKFCDCGFNYKTSTPCAHIISVAVYIDNYVIVNNLLKKYDELKKN